MDVLGTSKVVRYRRPNGAEVTVRGVFDDGAQTRTNSGLDFTEQGPRFTVKLADLNSDPTVELESVLIVGGVEFDIRDARKDGEGLIVLILVRRSAS